MVAVDAFINLGTPVYEGIVLSGLGRCEEADGDTPAARARYQEALEIGRRLGEPGVTASALEGLARLAWAAGDRGAATAQFGEAAGIRERFNRPAPPHTRSCAASWHTLASPRRHSTARRVLDARISEG